MPPARWLMGRVVETYPGKDGLVRVVSVRTPVGVLRGPLVRLVLLPVALPELDMIHQLGEECWSLIYYYSARRIHLYRHDFISIDGDLISIDGDLISIDGDLISIDDDFISIDRDFISIDMITSL
ncbi:hypothetical protein LAZ67_5003996 [Cordylochernes scorpioides]|uniref:DUF5641 domain-containing protein n=1 Tax=Cordylochernes scorpioides TaxID=51811 RepID=A0ABY6KKS0_9ARAC|nr:hypothetical protein LAZ67_5003996 [Cordylochernes scorpioides]